MSGELFPVEVFQMKALAKVLWILLGLLLTVVSGSLAFGAQQSAVPVSDGIYLTVTRIGNGQPFALMTNNSSVQPITAPRVELRFPTDRPFGFLALMLPSETGWLSVRLRVVHDGRDVSQVTATGSRIMGDVLNDTPRVALFR
jgi:hypothetical protein